MTLRTTAILTGMILAGVSPAPALAQQVSDVIPSLITERITIRGRETTPALVNDRGPAAQDDHVAHFFQGDYNRLVRVATLTNAALVSQLASYPIGYSSGGFTYAFDPRTNSDRRSSLSFGPSFAERPVTIGKGQWNVAVNFQHMSFDTLEGKDLDSGEIRFYFRHNDCCPAATAGNSPNVPAFEQDVIEGSLRVDLSATTTALSASYGVTRNFDLGVIVPVINVDMSARLNTQIIRLGSENNPSVAGVPIHTFPGGSTDNPAPPAAAASATGMGDVQLRAKYHFLQAGDGSGGLAAAVSVRLPTGDEEDLLGTGTTQARFALVGAATFGRFYPHVNVGFTVSGKGFVNEQAQRLSLSGTDSSSAIAGLADLRQPNEANYVFGFDSALTSRLTVAADIIGLTLLDPVGLGDQQIQPPCASCPPLSNTFEEFSPRTGNVNSLFGSAGVRFNPMSNLLISGNLLFPLSDEGLVDKLTPVIGVEFAF